MTINAKGKTTIFMCKKKQYIHIHTKAYWCLKFNYIIIIKNILYNKRFNNNKLMSDFITISRIALRGYMGVTISNNRYLDIYDDNSQSLTEGY